MYEEKLTEALTKRQSENIKYLKDTLSKMKSKELASISSGVLPDMVGFGEPSGSQKSAFSQWKNGVRTIPEKNAIALANYFHVDKEFIQGETKLPSKNVEFFVKITNFKPDTAAALLRHCGAVMFHRVSTDKPVTRSHKILEVIGQILSSPQGESVAIAMYDALYSNENIFEQKTNAAHEMNSNAPQRWHNEVDADAMILSQRHRLDKLQLRTETLRASIEKGEAEDGKHQEN